MEQSPNRQNQSKLSEEDRRKIVTKAHETLWTNEGSQALEYLKNKRNLSNSVIKTFQIGYVPSRVKHPCAGRIIMPIFDPYSELVAISTRHLHKKKNEPGHFWHESFEKSFYLYGMHAAKYNIVKYQKAVLVEGEMDVCTLHSYGCKIAVGVCGGSFSFYQASLIARYCHELYLLTDPDESGMHSCIRAIHMRYQDQYFPEMRFIPVSLPNKQDPDEFVVYNGVKALSKIMKQKKQQKKETCEDFGIAR